MKKLYTLYMTLLTSLLTATPLFASRYNSSAFSSSSFQSMVYNETMQTIAPEYYEETKDRQQAYQQGMRDMHNEQLREDEHRRIDHEVYATRYREKRSPSFKLPGLFIKGVCHNYIDNSSEKCPLMCKNQNVILGIGNYGFKQLKYKRKCRACHKNILPKHINNKVLYFYDCKYTIEGPRKSDQEFETIEESESTNYSDVTEVEINNYDLGLYEYVEIKTESKPSSCVIL